MEENLKLNFTLSMTQSLFHGEFSFSSSKVQDLYFMWYPLNTSPGFTKTATVELQLSTQCVPYPFEVKLSSDLSQKVHKLFAYMFFLSLRWPQFTLLTLTVHVHPVSWLVDRSYVCMYICTYMYTHARPVVYYRTWFIKTKILMTAAE